MKKYFCALLSGSIWAIIGFMLLRKGLSFLVLSKTQAISHVFDFILHLTKSKSLTGIVLICIALFLGLMKGRTIIKKSAERIMVNWEKSDKISPFNLFDKRGYILMGLMMGLGFVFNVLPIPYDIRGIIDVAVGYALLHGSFAFFRAIPKLKRV